MVHNLRHDHPLHSLQVLLGDLDQVVGVARAKDLLADLDDLPTNTTVAGLA